MVGEKDTGNAGLNLGDGDSRSLFLGKTGTPERTQDSHSRGNDQATNHSATPAAGNTLDEKDPPQLPACQRADIEKLMSLMYRYYHTYEVLKSTGSIDFELSSLINGAVKRHQGIPLNDPDLFPELGYYKLGTFVFCAPSREKLSEITAMLHSYIDNAGLADEERSVEMRGSVAGLEEKFGASAGSISDKVDKIMKNIDASVNKALSYKAKAEDAYRKIEDAVEKSDVLFIRRGFMTSIIANLKILSELEKDTGSLVKTHVEIDLACLYDIAYDAYSMIRKFREQVINKIGKDSYNHQARAVSNDELDTQINKHIDEMYKAKKETKNSKSWVLERSTRIGMLENLYIDFAKVLGEGTTKNDETDEIEIVGHVEVIKTNGIYKGKLGKQRTAIVAITSKYNQF